MEGMKGGKIVAYCRVSTSEQDVSSQKEKVRDFATKNGYEISEWFVDEAISGAEEERPQLVALKNWVINNNGGSVIMSNVDRLARDFYIFAMYSRLFKDNNVTPIYIATPQSGEPAMDNLIQMILGAFAEFEKNIIKERFMRGKRYKVKNGLASGGGKPPYGYKITKTDIGNFMTINEEEASVVRKIFNLYTDDLYSVYEIKKWLNKEGIVPGKRFNGFRRDTGWSISGLNYLLTSKVYLGEWIFGKTIVTGGKHHQKQIKRDINDPHLIKIKIPRIITDDVFTKAQERRTNRSRKWGILSPNKRDYFLKGVVTCGICRYQYCGVSGHAGKNTYYRCSSYNHLINENGKRGCGNITFRAKEIEEILKKEVIKILLSPDDLRRRLEKRANNEELDKGYLIEKKKAIEIKLKEIEDKNNKLLDQYASGIFTPSEIKEYKKNLEVEKIKANENLDEVLEQLGENEKFTNYQEFTKSLSGLSDKFLKPFSEWWTEEQKMNMEADLFQEYVKQVIVYPDKAIIKFAIPIKDKELLLKSSPQKVIEYYIKL